MSDTLLHLDDHPGFDPIPLPFAWRDLPRRQCAPGGYSAISTGMSWTTTLPDGREIRLTGLHQYGTYAGVLAGVPSSDEVRAWPIEGALRMASDLHQCMPSQVALLPPELQVSGVKTRARGNRLVDIEVEFLPPVCSIGTFESAPRLGSADSDSSEVVMVWFQRAFGPPEQGYVTECIRSVDWEDLAADWHVIDM
jgi:hypothetical protein